MLTLKQKLNMPNVWILATPRTGSAFFHICFDKYGFIPKFAEKCCIPNKEKYPVNNKVFPKHLWCKNIDIPGLLALRPATKFIHIVRRDWIGQLTSQYIMERTGMPGYDRKTEDGREYSDVIGELSFNNKNGCFNELFNDFIKCSRFWPAQIKEHNLNVLEVISEDFFTDTFREFTRVFRFVDKTIDIDISQIKLNWYLPQRRKYSEKYKEIREAIENTECVQKYMEQLNND